MKNKPLHTPGASEEPPKENDDEDNNGVWTNGTNPNLSTERCPICLNFLTQDVGFPENCYHAFCVNCILRWSETSTSCPVDRKPFQIVYKINPAAGCTKIQVKTRRQRERCCCNGNPLYTLCCAKTKIRYRTDSSKELISHNVLFNKSDSFVSKEEKQASESELKTLNRHEPCYTSDFVSLSQQNAQLDLPLIGLHDVSEDGELDLIKQKREGLKYLRPTSAARRSDLMSFSGETEALSVSTTAFSLVDYIPPLCNFSIRNQGFSKRTCVHSGAQEGTEKKAASGASNGRGSRRKASQSSTRRRSTRNSKSEDMSHLPSSPKSNTSDRDSPDCNNSSANVSSADHTVKTPPKQRKRVPKKRSQARKRLRSATRTQEQSSGSKENSADESEEQLVKTRKISKKDAFKTADSDVDSIAEHSVEVQEPVDCRPSPSASPIQSQSDENTPASPPVRTEPFSDEKTLDSSSQNEQESDMEEEPSSQNNSVLMEKTSPTSPASVNLGNSACDHSALSPFADKSPSNSDEEASDFKKPQSSSEGENCSSSPVPKGDISDHTESPLSQTARRKGASDEEDSSFEKPYESDTEGNEKPLSKYSHESNSSDSSSSDEDDLSPKNDRPAEFLRNQSVLTEPDDLSDSRNGQLSPEPPLLENALNTCMDEKNSLSDQENPPELDNSPDFKVGENKINSGSAEAGRQEVPSFEKHNLESAIQESSCLPAEKYSMDDEAEGSSRNVQEAELKSSVEGKEITIEADESCKRSPEIQAAPTALQHSRPCVINSHSNDGFHDAKNNDTEGSSMPLDVTVSASLQTSHKSSNLRVDDGSLSDHRKELCDQDNNESIAMECESDSDHSESEIEQQAETDKIKGAESGAEVSVIKEEAKPQSAETVCVNEKTNEEAPKKESRPRRSRFHSPSTTWSPQKTDVKERQRSRSRGRDSPGKRMSRSRSRDRDGSRDRGGQWKGRSRERWHRRHSRSKSKSRSRSRSPSRPAARNKGPPPERNEMGCGSPPWREKRQYDNWRSPRGNERYRKHEQEKPSENFRRDRHDISRDSSEPYKDSSNQNDYPDWVAEKIKSEARGKSSTRSRVSPRGSHWDSNNYSQGESWNKSESMDWQSPRGRGGRGRGRGGFRGAFGYGEQSENRWNSRPTFSGNSNSSGPESRFPEQRNYRTKYEQEPYDSPADRSGWSSASSWAVRKTLPADVQNYYSKRGRSQAGSQPAWPKHDESPDQALKVDQPIKDQVSQPAEAPQMPVNLIPPQMNVVQPQMNQPPPQPMNMFPYSVSVPPPPLVSIQHNPYSIHAQLPMHIHPGLPIQVPVQVSAPASVSQGLPPPPPPPPPSQQVNYVTSQPEGKLMQVNPGATHAGNNYSAPLLPAPAATIGIVGTVLGPNAGIVASSTHSKTPHFSVKPPVRKDFITVEATADGSKKEKKLQIQERAAHEVKMAIKQYYQNKDITKDEYKEIVKKAVDKVCHSKSGEVDSAKVANLIKAYVDKYKHSRKKE